MARPEDTRRRVASLLGAPATAEGAQPTALALANFPDSNKLAEEAVAMAATEKAANGDAAELAKAAATAMPAPQTDAAAPQPALADASSAPAAARLAAIDIAPSAASAPQPSAEPAPRAAQRMVSNPVIQSTHRGMPVAPAAVAAARGSHIVQLGSFASADGAQRAWRHFAARNPGLGSYHSQITQVAVNGRQFWRVQAVGFSGFASARQMCQSVKAKGGVCLVMSEPTGVSPQGRPAAMRMAQR